MESAELRGWCELANVASFVLLGVRNTCVATSLALAEALRGCGVDGVVVRTQAIAYCGSDLPSPCLPYAATVGSPYSIATGGWRGHLAVDCGDYILDPTLDQLSVCGFRPIPAVFRKPAGWHDGKWRRWNDGPLRMGSALVERQTGWTDAPAAQRDYYMRIHDEMHEIRSYMTQELRHPAMSSGALPQDDAHRCTLAK